MNFEIIGTIILILAILVAVFWGAWALLPKLIGWLLMLVGVLLVGALSYIGFMAWVISHLH